MFQSILPPEAYLQEAQPMKPFECRACGYGHLEGRRDAQGRFVVARVISTDPAAYLDAACAPGAALDVPLDVPLDIQLPPAGE